MQSKIGKLVALHEGLDEEEEQPQTGGALPNHENIDLEYVASAVGPLELEVWKTCLVEPTRGQNSTRREHNAECQHIYWRLIGEQEVGLDAAWVIKRQKMFFRSSSHPPFNGRNSFPKHCLSSRGSWRQSD